MEILAAPPGSVGRESRVCRRCLQFLACCALLVIGALALATNAPKLLPVAQEAESGSGYELKAAFLYNFIQYVTWPDTKENTGEFNLCLLGKNPFGVALQALQGKTALNLPLKVKELRQVGEAQSCHLLFISASEQARLPDIVAALQGGGVLTVSDTEGDAEAGVVINFVLRQNKLRFAINPDAAKSNGLRISAHLLRLAEIVHSGGL